MTNVAELRMEKHELKQKGVALCDAATKRGKDLAGAELEQYNKLFARIVEIDAALEEHQAGAHFSKPGAPVPNLQPWASAGRGREIEVPSPFAQFLRTGVMASADLGPTQDGAVLIPEVLYREVTHREAGFRPLEQVARIVQTDSGEPWKFPRIDDSVDGEYLAASANTGNAAPPSSLDSILLGAFKASSKPIAVSRELLTDSSYDVGREIVAVQLNRTGRLLNSSFTSGDGVGKPTGFLTGCTYVEAAGASLTLDDVLALVYGVKQQYRVNQRIHDALQHAEVLALVEDRHHERPNPALAGIAACRRTAHPLRHKSHHQ